MTDVDPTKTTLEDADAHARIKLGKMREKHQETGQMHDVLREFAVAAERMAEAVDQMRIISDTLRDAGNKLRFGAVRARDLVAEMVRQKGG